MENIVDVEELNRFDVNVILAELSPETATLPPTRQAEIKRHLAQLCRQIRLSRIETAEYQRRAAERATIEAARVAAPPTPEQILEERIIEAIKGAGEPLDTARLRERVPAERALFVRACQSLESSGRASRLLNHPSLPQHSYDGAGIWRLRAW